MFIYTGYGMFDITGCRLELRRETTARSESKHQRVFTHYKLVVVRPPSGGLQKSPEHMLAYLGTDRDQAVQLLTTILDFIHKSLLQHGARSCYLARFAHPERGIRIDSPALQAAVHPEQLEVLPEEQESAS